MILEQMVGFTDVLKAISYISIDLAVKLKANFQAFILILKGLMVITKQFIIDPNVFIALRYLLFVLAKELEPNCQRFPMVLK
jgi:hypothetical protein